ncbi:MAG: non-canonical purine NTP diphosphatase [Bacteroidota bacterium]
MKQLVFATANPNKVREVAAMLKDYDLPIVSMKEIGCEDDIPETQDTLEGNALQKARYLRDKYQVDCFAEDTGLEIDSLNGEPGVYTARYAGPERNADANMDLVLQKLQGQDNRQARFRTVFALILDGKEYTFEGKVEGRIGEEKQGEGGFGYDPLFWPEGHTVNFAQMPLAQKNEISHRGRALQQLKAFLLAQ